MKVKSFLAMLLAMLTLVIVGCGGGDGGAQPFATAPTASAPVASADGTTATSTITATLPANTPDGTVVNFAIVSGNGTLSSATATTVGGIATVELTGTAPGDVVVRVSSGNFAQNLTVTFPAGTLTVTANPTTVAVNTTSIISAQLPSATAGVTVSFALTGPGTLSAPTAVTDATGLATVTLTAPATPGSATVTATAGLLIGNVVDITYIADPNAPGAVTITANPASSFVNQSVVVTATVAPAGVGGVIADGTVVTFASTLGTFTNVTTTTGGVATATLTFGATAGTDSVTASAAGISSAPLSIVVGAQPTTVTVRVSTTGTLPAGTLIGGITAHIIANPSAGLSIAAGNVVTSGVGVGSTLIPNVNNVADVILGLISATGIQTGEFATATYQIAAGTFPNATDFTVGALGSGTPATQIIDTNGIVIPGINLAVSVTIQ
jgi:adhesin/invasin